jgi:hypothetical protein
LTAVTAPEAEQVTPRNEQWEWWWRPEVAEEDELPPVGWRPCHVGRRTRWAAGGSAATKESRMAVAPSHHLIPISVKLHEAREAASRIHGGASDPAWSGREKAGVECAWG